MELRRTCLVFALIINAVRKAYSHLFPWKQFFEMCFNFHLFHSNKDIANATFSYRNDESGIKLNLTLEIFKVLEKVRANLKVRLPMDENDQNYKNEFFQTSIDVEKMFKNIHGNFMIKMVTEPYFKSLENQKYSFPIVKVRRHQACQSEIQFFVYRAFTKRST
jgi:hypothetical protein